MPKLSSSSSVVSDHSSTPNGTASHQNEASASVPSSPSTAASDPAAPTAGGSAQREPALPISSISYLAHNPSFNCHLCTAEYSTYTKLRGWHTYPVTVSVLVHFRSISNKALDKKGTTPKRGYFMTTPNIFTCKLLTTLSGLTPSHFEQDYYSYEYNVSYIGERMVFLIKVKGVV